MQKVLSPVHADSRAKLGIRPGDTVRVEQKIIEFKRGKGTDKKEKITQNARTQAFEGLVLAVKHGKEAGATFTVRATLSGVGVEKVFPLYSPSIDSIEIVRRSKVRRAKLYFIREKAAKEVRRQLRNARRVSITEEVAVPEEVAPTVEDVAVAVAEEAVAE
jgi:large subunit ribosomal protein L19